MQRIIRLAMYLALGIMAIAVGGLIVAAGQAHRREVQTAAEAAPPTGRFVHAMDVELFVQEAGPPQGPAVLLVHGTGAWSETWRPTMVALAEAGYHAIAIDLPPFGYSQRPETADYTRERQGARIAAVLEALEVRDVVLVGHSFGAGPTVEAALVAGDRARALVLVDAALGVRAEGEAPSPPSMPVRALLAIPPLRDAVVAALLTNPAMARRLIQSFIDDPARATEERVEVYRRPLAVAGTTASVGDWLPSLLGPGSDAPSEQEATYRALRLPVVAIWGGRDTITPPEQGRRLVSITPGAELLLLDDVGHIPQLEDPPQFNRLLLDALRRVSRRRASRCCPRA